MTDRYRRWDNLIYKTAIKTIGQSTSKSRKNPKLSVEVLQLRKEKRDLKNMFEKEKDYTMKGQFLEGYINKQKEIQGLLKSEEKVRSKRKF